MRLATVRFEGEEIAAITGPGGVVPIGAIEGLETEQQAMDMLCLLESGQFYKLWGRYDDGLVEGLTDQAIPLHEIEYGPLYRRPRKIWGIGLNYVGHAGDKAAAAPDEPASFMKPDTTIIGPGDEILLPEQSEQVTGEAELGIVIGRRVKSISEAEAPSVVAGLTTVIDVTAEDILRRNPRYLTRAKSFDTFFSFGPHLVTLDEVGDVEELMVTTVLNGEPHRTDSVSNMAFSPWALVSFHSKVMTLLPGDIILTGTPGAAVIRDGDVVACHIDGFEPLSNLVRG